MVQLMPSTLAEQRQARIDAHIDRYIDSAPSNSIRHILDHALEISQGFDNVRNDVLTQDHNEQGADNNEHGPEPSQQVQQHGDDSVVPGQEGQ